MLIRNFSDLHLNFDTGLMKNKKIAMYDFWLPPKLPTDHETCCVLAGDIWEEDRFIEWGEDRYSWIKKISEQFKWVILVLGNHDYWGANVTISPSKFQDKINALSISNVHLLERRAIILDGIKFVGATLWTDMNREHPHTVYSADFVMGKDFQYIKKNPSYVPFKPNDWLSIHYKSVDFIRDECKKNDIPIVVVTHHAPCEMSIDKHYRSQFIDNGFYHSRLDDLIFDNPSIILWFHGHIHSQSDYVLGATTVICNPRGYVGYELNYDFDETRVIDTSHHGRLSFATE